MTSRPDPVSPGHDPAKDAAGATASDKPSRAADIFAGLTAIDVIEGELVPRQS